MSHICRNCGCTESQAIADARTLGLEREYQNGFYTCCQVVVWADEQWLAWLEAASEDGKPIEEAVVPLERMSADVDLAPVRNRNSQDFQSRSSLD